MAEREFDENRDYYQTLGVSPEATVEELKNAHVQLALRYHPDMSAAKRVGFNAAETAGKFREVSEAWQILSKPEVRQKYDGARRRLLGPASSSTIGGIPSEVPTSFNTHKTNFVNVQKAASSNWRDIQDKYKSEKWQKLPLKDRKNHRARTVHSIWSSIVYVAFPIAFTAAAAYGHYKWTHRQYKDTGAKKKTITKVAS